MTEKRALEADCGACGHRFTVAQLPLDAGEAVRLCEAAICPRCESDRLLLAGDRRPRHPIYSALE